jgi:hypothetical protein
LPKECEAEKFPVVVIQNAFQKNFQLCNDADTSSEYFSDIEVLLIIYLLLFFLFIIIFLICLFIIYIANI